jgi:hypothetical protein
MASSRLLLACLAWNWSRLSFMSLMSATIDCHASMDRTWSFKRLTLS